MPANTSVCPPLRLPDGSFGAIESPRAALLQAIETNLTSAQLTVWAAQQLHPASPVYTIPKVVHFSRPIEPVHFITAFHRLVEACDAFRSVFEEIEGVPRQRVLPVVPRETGFLDLSAAADPASAFRAWLEVRSRQVFKLDDCLYDSVLVKLDAEEFKWFTSQHHLIVDGTTTALFFRHLATLYERARQGRLHEPFELPRFLEHAAAARTEAASAGAAESRQYWQRVLAEPAEPPRFYGSPRTARTLEARKLSRELGPERSGRLRELCARPPLAAKTPGIAVFNVFATVLFAWLHRLGGGTGHVLHTPQHNRRTDQARQTLGLIMQVAPLRVELAPEETFASLAASVAAVSREAAAHARSVPPPAPGTGSADVVFNYLHRTFPEFAGGPVRFEWGHSGHTLHPAVFNLHDFADTGCLTLDFEHQRDRFTPAQAERALDHLFRLLDAFLENPHQPIARVKLLAPDEEDTVVRGFNRTRHPFPENRRLHELVAGSATAWPDKTALEWDNGSMSYAELDRRTGNLAHKLRREGAGPESLVGLFLDRSPELVVSMLAVLQADAAFLPLSPEDPPERLRGVLDANGVRLLLTTRALAAGLAGLPVRCLCVEDLLAGGDPEPRAADASAPDHVAPAGANSLACVICTSGSTGSPKAVALEHRSLVNFVLAAARAYPVEARDRVLQFASPGFDAALEEIFTTLTAGATLVIRTAEDAASIPDFLAACRRRAVTVASLPTAFWHELIRHAEAGHLEPPDALRLVVIGGERARPDAAAAWRRWTAGRIRLLNTYGPTEAGVVATCADLTLPEPDGEDTEPPIGRPLANVTAYVLDALRQPAPVGVTGELFLGGAGIARGYWREETLTAERFVPDSFSGAPGVRLYRTGDLARWRPDGQLEFAGRLDNQIKLRGHRIEPGEIESCLNTHPAVRESLVLLREAASGPRLAAYLTPRPGQSPDAADLRRHLRQRLPEIMVPAHFVTLAAWPLTARGKIDRRALPAPGASESGPSAPMNATERRVAAVWGDVLGVRGIGRDSHFFDLGGHSLLAMQVLARLQHEFGARPTLRQFFEAPTVAALAAALDSLPVREELERLAAGPRPARVPASFAQQRLWFLEQLEPGGAAYHIPALARLRGDLDADRLRRGLNGVIRRHESLRTTFVAPDGEPEQVIAPALDLPLPREDWRDLAPRERDARLAELRAAEAARPFDLNRGPLLRARLVRVADDDWFLLLTLHHLIADGWSVGVLLAELARDYDALAEGAPASPPPPAQYADYTLWQRARLRGPALERDLAFWTQHLAGAPPALEFPTDHPRPPVPRFAAASATLALPASLGAAARALAREEGATLFMTLLAVFQALLHRLTGQSDLVVGTPVAGRTTAETENLVGLFVNTLALRSRVGPGPDLPGFREFLRRARATCLDAFSHQEAPFEQLVERLQPARDRGRTPVFQVFFNLLNLAKPGFTSRHLRFEGLELTDSGAKFDFTLYVRERPDGDELHLVYNRELFDAARMEELLRQYRALLAQAVRQPETPLHSLSLVTLEAAALLPNPRDPLRAQWHGPVPELFARQARRTPERVAVTGAGASWTYAALDRRARQVAQRLRAGGVQRGDVVAIHARRHPALAVALLGVFKAGAVTMLLDSNYPAALLRGLVASVKPRGWVHLAAGRAAPEDILALARRCDCFVDLTANEGEASLPADAPDADPGVTLAADDLACLSFTSGTTGRPRGVLTTHGPLSHFFNWQPAQFGLNETDRFSVLSGLGHDPLLRNIFTALSIGATVCVPDDATVRDPDRLLAWLREERITVAHLTPGVAQLLAGTEETRRRDGLPHLRWAFFGGDKLRRADAAALRALAPGVRCVNFYGTTETPQAMSWCEVAEVGKGARCPDPAAVVPIGRGIPAAQLLVLAGAGQLAGVGEPGEIHVRTPCLARGYLDDPAQTQARFLTNPFTDLADDRVYRTGDIGRYLPDGAVEWLGRADRQLKVRGFRLEPAEVEARLLEHPDARAALVIATADAHGDARLVGYVVVRAGAALEARAWRRFLLARLPEPAVPSALVRLERLPLTPNGKPDPRALPAPEQAVTEGATPSGPRDLLEAHLLRAWETVLGRQGVGVRDNFFELGGHSLMAARLFAQLERSVGLRLPLAVLFEAPTIEAQAAALRRSGWTPPWSSLVAIQPAGRRPPFFCVHGVGGNVLGFQSLARHLGADQPVYGLQSAGLDGRRAPHTRFEDMAAHYLRELRRLQPEGPYFLGGLSFGGLIAYEMACQLRESGEEVALVALFDTASRGFLASLSPAQAARARLESIGARLRFNLRQQLAGPDRAGFLRRKFRALLRRWRRRLWQALHSWFPHRGATLPAPLRGVREANYLASRRYVPRPYAGRLALFRAAEKQVGRLKEHDLGWSRLARGGVDVREVAGSHTSMILEPHVAVLAARLRETMDRAMATPGAAKQSCPQPAAA